MSCQSPKSRELPPPSSTLNSNATNITLQSSDHLSPDSSISPVTSYSPVMIFSKQTQSGSNSSIAEWKWVEGDHELNKPLPNYLWDDIKLNCQQFQTPKPSCTRVARHKNSTINFCEDKGRCTKYSLPGSTETLLAARFVCKNSQIVVVQQKQDSKEPPFNNRQAAIIFPSKGPLWNKKKVLWFVWDPKRAHDDYNRDTLHVERFTAQDEETVRDGDNNRKLPDQPTIVGPKRARTTYEQDVNGTEVDKRQLGVKRTATTLSSKLICTSGRVAPRSNDSFSGTQSSTIPISPIINLRDLGPRAPYPTPPPSAPHSTRTFTTPPAVSFASGTTPKHTNVVNTTQQRRADESRSADAAAHTPAYEVPHFVFQISPSVISEYRIPVSKIINASDLFVHARYNDLATVSTSVLQITFQGETTVLLKNYSRHFEDFLRKVTTHGGSVSSDVIVAKYEPVKENE